MTTYELLVLADEGITEFSVSRYAIHLDGAPFCWRSSKETLESTLNNFKRYIPKHRLSVLECAYDTSKYEILYSK